MKNADSKRITMNHKRTSTLVPDLAQMSFETDEQDSVISQPQQADPIIKKLMPLKKKKIKTVADRLLAYQRLYALKKDHIKEDIVQKEMKSIPTISEKTQKIIA